MTVRELHDKLKKLLDDHADEPVYADITLWQEADPMPPIDSVYAVDGYVCIGD